MVGKGKTRIRITPEEAYHLGLPPRADKGRNSSQHNLTEEQLQLLKELRNQGIIEACQSLNVDPTTPKFVWLKSKEASIPAQNPLYKEQHEQEREQIEAAFERIVENYAKGIVRKRIDLTEPTKNKAIKVTISDSHIGMNPNPNGGALFQYEYNPEVYNNSINKVFKSVLKEFNTHGYFDLLLIDDLGDLADGWNGQTTRGGHDLPQNMTNAEVFETCVDAYTSLIRDLVEAKVAKKIILRCICNDNHSGDFALIINKAIQKIVNLMYNEDVVEVDLLERFIEHRIYGDHCFILSHGKDKKQMKTGLPIVLNDKAKGLLNDYIDHYEIKSKFIHVEKGDLHQVGYQRTKKFDYRNYMSFAPPSSWIQHNFGDTYSGYSIQVIPKHSNEISHTDYFLEYKKIKQ